MASISVVWRDCSESKNVLRFRIYLKQDGMNTSNLYSEIARHCNSGENDFEVVYCGQRVIKGAPLSTLNLTPQSTLFAFSKQPKPLKNVPESNWHTVMTTVHHAVKNPNYRKIVEQLINNQNSLQRLLAAVPGLDQDAVVMSMVLDPELLVIMVQRQNIFKLLQKHPLFGPAVTYIAGEVNKSQPLDFVRPSRSNVYSLDQMSDEEDEGQQQAGALGGAPQQVVTASQLAAALAAATGGAGTAAARSSASRGSQPGASASSSGSGPLITSDFFQQAMMSAQSTALEAQIQQLRDMGITDENVARQALQATNGNLQAALDLIFGN